MLATWLIFVPIVGGLLVWLLPWRNPGLFALAVALGELGLWIGSVASFDFGASGLQHDTTAVWFEDLGVSYKVGFYDFSLWLVGLTVGVGLLAIVYALRAGRDRARAYFGLMLVLVGATVGVFAAQDLLLFYVFFEAMLIPLYVLIGVWGGTNSRAATIKFVIYTMVGSLLMLVSIVALGLSQGTFDLTQMGTNGSLVMFLGFAIAFGIKAPIWPFHGWLPDAYRESPAEVSAILSGVISKTAAYGFLRITLPVFPEPVATMRDTILVLAAIGLVYGSLLAFRALDFRGVIAYSSLAQMSLIVIGIFAVNDSGVQGALLQMVNHGLVSAGLFFLAGYVERRTATGQLSLLGGMARGRPILATVLIILGVIALAVPGSSAFAAEFLILNGVFAHGWGWAVVGAIAIVLAAMYMLRAISATLHEKKGQAVHDRVPDLRPAELAVLVPVVATLLFLSFWPAGVTDHSFGGKPSTYPIAEVTDVSSSTVAEASP
jgi:NADH-quinone oxidoreductase subunit M